ncbi:hypothetical protein BJ912DRAFT_1146820, partial [Pholiota molesta]
MWALALGNADGRKGEGTQGRPKSGRPSRCARRAAHLAYPLTHIHVPTVSARGDEGRGHRPRPPFFMPSRGHSHRTPRPPRCSPPGPRALPGRRDEAACTNPATPVPLASHPRPSPYPSVPRAHRTPVRAHAHASEARPASDGPRTYNERSPPADGGAGCCCITACGGARLAQGLHGETTSNGDAKVAIAHCHLFTRCCSVGRQACARVRALPAVADWTSCGWWEAQSGDQASPKRASGGMGECEHPEGIGEEQAARIIPFQHA